MLQHDLELAFQADAVIRQTREVFDTDFVEPRSPPGSDPTSAMEQPPLTEPIIREMPTSLESALCTIPTHLTATDDSIFGTHVDFLLANQAEPVLAPDLSYFVAFALPFDAAIAPQLSEHIPQASGRISLKEHATERALQLAEAFQLTNSDVQTLAKILRRYRLHHKTVTELEALLQDGYSADELSTANKIRKIWRRSEYPRTEIPRCYQEQLNLGPVAESPYTSHCDFLEELYKPGHRAIFITSTRIPTWRKATKWARTLGNMSSSELDVILFWHYERWLETPIFWTSAPSFMTHVDRCLRTIAHDLHDILPWEIAFERAEVDYYDDNERERAKRRELYALGLIPDIWIDTFDERISIDPELPLLDDYWPKKE